MIKIKSTKFLRTYKIQMILKNPQMIFKVKQILKKNKIEILDEKITGCKIELKIHEYKKDLNNIEFADDVFVDIIEFQEMSAL